MQKKIVGRFVLPSLCERKGEMTMKPILFNAEMVRAILEGRKTVTRRIVKPQPEISCPGSENECTHEKGFWDMGGNSWACRQCGYGVIPIKGGSWIAAPYQSGDILYVRETWTETCPYPLDDCPSGKPKQARTLCEVCMHNGPYYYRADNVDNGSVKWKPSIHMPKEAARIWLKIVDVRAERLQNIRPVDVINEGAYEDCRDCLDTYGESGFQCCYQKEDECSQCDSVMMEWVRLWNSTIKKTDHDCYGWEANPWVWVIEFVRCDKEGKELG